MRNKQLYAQYLKSYINGRTGFVNDGMIKSFEQESDLGFLLAAAEGFDDGMIDTSNDNQHGTSVVDVDDDAPVSGPASFLTVITRIEEKMIEEETEEID